MSNELPDQLMDVKEAAAIIGVTVGRVRQLAAAGKLKGERLGGPERGLWVFRRADVVAYAARPRRAGRPHKAALLERGVDTIIKRTEWSTATFLVAISPVGMVHIMSESGPYTVCHRPINDDWQWDEKRFALFAIRLAGVPLCQRCERSL